MLERLVPELTAGGLKVGCIKHAAHGLDEEAAGKDSSRLATAGAAPAIAAGPNGLIVQHAAAEVPLLDLAQIFCPGCDLVLAEGYKRSPHDKILLATGAPARPGGRESQLPSVRLVVSGTPESGGVGLRYEDTAGLAAWVRQWLDRRRSLGRDVAAAVLVGGQSRRMGTDKVALRFGGRSVLARLAELLGGRTEDVWIIGRSAAGAPASGPAGHELPRCLRWHLDLRSGCGPLGGIATALRIADEGRAVLAIACDMPALGGELVDLLMENRDRAAPASALDNPQTGQLEPLAALYEPAALPQIERALEAAEFSATRLLESAGAHRIPVPPELAGQLANVNRPEDMRRLHP